MKKDYALPHKELLILQAQDRMAQALFNNEEKKYSYTSKFSKENDILKVKEGSQAIRINLEKIKIDCFETVHQTASIK